MNEFTATMPVSQIHSESLHAVARPIEYEFTAEENDVIRGTVSAMRTLSALVFINAASMLVIGACQLKLGNLGGAFVNGFFALLAGSFGLLLRPGANALERVVTTEGDDIAHVITAMGALRRLYRGQTVVVVLDLLFLALMLAVSVFAALQ